MDRALLDQPHHRRRIRRIAGSPLREPTPHVRQCRVHRRIHRRGTFEAVEPIAVTDLTDAGLGGIQVRQHCMSVLVEIAGARLFDRTNEIG